MSGHSKWSKVKHQKATTDVVKAAAFTKASHAIAIAVREGGGIGDPDKNFRLRLAVEKARQVNMPKDNIQRAIAKGKGEGGRMIESIMYEGYGPKGAAILVETATDNKQRTVAQIKNVFEREGGSLAGKGAVSYLFTPAGILVVEKTPGISLDHLMELAIDLGADDVVEKDDVFEIYTQNALLMEVKKKLEQEGIGIENAELIMRPKTTLMLPNEWEQRVWALEDRLRGLEDVQRVYTNVV